MALLRKCPRRRWWSDRRSRPRRRAPVPGPSPAGRSRRTRCRGTRNESRALVRSLQVAPQHLARVTLERGVVEVVMSQNTRASVARSLSCRPPRGTRRCWRRAWPARRSPASARNRRSTSRRRSCRPRKCVLQLRRADGKALQAAEHVGEPVGSVVPRASHRGKDIVMLLSRASLPLYVGQIPGGSPKFRRKRFRG